jgi:hypothetical protein
MGESALQLRFQLKFQEARIAAKSRKKTAAGAGLQFCAEATSPGITAGNLHPSSCLEVAKLAK